jgi:hypothetical protein
MPTCNDKPDSCSHLGDACEVDAACCEGEGTCIGGFCSIMPADQTNAGPEGHMTLGRSPSV